MTRATLCVPAMMMMAGVAVLAQGQSPNFSGTWKLDPSRSRMVEPAGLAGVIATGAPETLHITHALNGTVVLESEMNEGHARMYTPGGKSVTPVGQGGSITMTSQSDGRTLVSEGTQQDASGVSMSVKEMLALSSDGRILTIEVTKTSGSETKVSTLTYTRTNDVRPCESWPTPCKAWPAPAGTKFGH
ncbi:MAG: hypothetical protein LC791_11925 [Acidobacteria bacterium]|nr:hypothetical protein [Acidobacteriota bacterium]